MSRDRGTLRAVDAFREAFARLKADSPTILPKGTPVSQNNVAKEAGCDPSALRKTRYPDLIREIRNWIGSVGASAESGRSKKAKARRRNRSLLKKIADLTLQRDCASSLLVEADAKILELAQEIASLRQQPSTKSNVTSIEQARRRRS